MKPTVNYALKTLFILGFVGMLMLPLFLTRMGLEDALKGGLVARVDASTRVPFTPLALRRQITAVDDWRRKFSSMFWGRSWLLEQVALLKLERTQSSRWREDALRGELPWLYLAGNETNDTIDNWRGTFQYSETELDRICVVVRAWQDWSEARGMEFLMVVPPNKVSIYPEYMPDWLTPFDGPTSTSRLITRLREAGVNLLDLKPVLEPEKANHLLYYRTDTHWNQLGAFFCARAILGSDAFAKFGMGSPELTEYRIEWEEGEGGDLSRPIEFAPQLAEPRAILTRITGITSEYVWPNRHYHQLIRQTNEHAAPNAPRLFTVNDSFLHAPERFLYRNCRELLSWWTADYQFPVDVILEEQPDILVFSVLERFLPYLSELRLPPAP